MRRMYDSTSAADIPADAPMVAGYIDGLFAWPPAAWARFPNAVKVRIACFSSTNDGQVLDVESGCSTPAQAPDWVKRRRAAGVDPTVYVNRSNWPAVRSAFQAAHVPEPHYWLASYDNRPEVPAGTVAKQYANPPASGGHFDLSAVLDYWPGVDNQPPANEMPSGWADWQRIPGIAKSIAAVSFIDGRVDLFVVGEDNAVYHTWWPK